jgi:large subunit ribosomal protein L32
MAVPKRRTSHSAQGHRRSHHFLKGKMVQYCPNCGDPTLPHRVCSKCGYYRNREVIQMEAQEGQGA